MKQIFLDRQGSLRNGWWMLVFVVLFLASRPLYRVVSQAMQAQGLDGAWLEPLPIVFLLLVTALCLRLRRERLADVGLRADLSASRQLLAGVVVGTGLMLVVTALIMAAGGVRFSLDPARSVDALLMGSWLFVCVALLEELLFRGFLFQRLIDGIGEWPALLAMAAVFALAHWGNPGMESATLFWASLDTALGALLLGLAYLRTRSLALPIGIHFGWNWAQGTLLGFDVSGIDHAGWLLPQLLDQPQWLTGGAFGPEASVFATLVDAVAVMIMWRWKGTYARHRTLPPPAALAIARG